MQNITSDSDILSNCLEQIERGHATIESCIRRYPEFKELRELLQVACIMRELPAPKLNPVSRSAIEQKMLSRFKQTQAVRAKQLINSPRPAPTFAPRPRQSSGWVMRFASVAFILIMVFFTGSAGLVQAASSAVPGDTLYNVKRSVEQFQLSVADNQSIPGVLEQIAVARLMEIKTLSDRGRSLDPIFVDDAMNSVREAVLAQTDFQARDLLLWQARSAFVYAGERGAILPEKQVMLVTMLDTVYNETPGDPSTVLNVDPTNTATSTITYTATFTETAIHTATSTKTKTPKPSNTPTSEPTSTPTNTPTKKAPPQVPPGNAGGNNGGGNNGGGNAGGNNGGGNNGGGNNGGGNNSGGNNGGGNGNPPPPSNGGNGGNAGGNGGK